MAPLVLVPFDGGPAARAGLWAACLAAQKDGGQVAALYVVRIPRQLPLRADFSWLAREVTRVQLAAEPIIRQSGVEGWTEWVCARDLAPAIASVAGELQAGLILLGVRQQSQRRRWLRPWTLPTRLRRLAPCPVTVRALPVDGPARVHATSILVP